jgi:Uma2 family endonuclease
MALQLRQEAQETDVKRHLVTLDEYERMCEAGVFGGDARIELIRGEIVDMPPPGPKHQAVVAHLVELLGRLIGMAALVWPQGNVIRLPKSGSQPQPDVAVVHRRQDYYEGQAPGAEDVLLLVEVAQSALEYDRGDKLALYAEAAISEYWVVNLIDLVIEVYTNPSEGKYQSVKVARRGEILPLPNGLEGTIAVEDILS